jgi:hypothetical protein
MSHFKTPFTASLLVLASILLAGPSMALAAPPSGRLYLDGQIVRTHVVPARLPNGGVDPLYMFTNGVSDQVSVVTYGPGSPNYHGGAWAVNLVTFNTGVTPYLLTSADAVRQAEAAGDVTITRRADMDNRCPISP